MTSFSSDEFLTVAEVAARLRLNDQDGKELDRSRKAAPFRIGRPVRIARSDLDRFVDGGDTELPNASRGATKTRAFWDGAEESMGDIHEP